MLSKNDTVKYKTVYTLTATDKKTCHFANAIKLVENINTTTCSLCITLHKDFKQYMNMKSLNKFIIINYFIKYRSSKSGALGQITVSL